MNDETVQQWVIDVQDWAEHGRCLIISVFKLEQTTDLSTLHYTIYIKITVFLYVVQIHQVAAVILSWK